MGIFSSDPHPIEKLVTNATNENLTSEDWSQIIAVCDEVNNKPGKNGPIAVQALRNRLNSQNGNVQLYSLTLLNALAQNCGPILQKEIASTATTQALNKLSTNASTHRAVIIRLIDVLSSLVELFSSDKTLYQIEALYKKVCLAHPSISQSSASSPSSRQSISNNNSLKPQNAGKPSFNIDEEDEDLKKALELSMLDINKPNDDISVIPQQSVGQSKKYVKALYDFTASEDGELTFKTGDIIEVVDKVYKEWWKGILRGNEGIFPVNYVEPHEPSPAVISELNNRGTDSPNIRQTASDHVPMTHTVDFNSTPAAMDESYIFNKVPAVDKLLNILAMATQSGDGSVISNADVQRLYHQISSMRPRLVQLIDEYANKKQELIDINSKLLQARRTYDNLMSDAASSQHRMIQAPRGQSNLQLPSMPSGVRSSLSFVAERQPISSQQMGGYPTKGDSLHLQQPSSDPPAVPLLSLTNSHSTHNTQAYTYNKEVNPNQQMQAYPISQQYPVHNYHNYYSERADQSTLPKQSFQGQQPGAPDAGNFSQPIRSFQNTQFDQHDYSEQRHAYPEEAAIHYSSTEHPSTNKNGLRASITPSAPRTY